MRDKQSSAVCLLQTGGAGNLQLSPKGRSKKRPFLEDRRECRFAVQPFGYLTHTSHFIDGKYRPVETPGCYVRNLTVILQAPGTIPPPAPIGTRPHPRQSSAQQTMIFERNASSWFSAAAALWGGGGDFYGRKWVLKKKSGWDGLCLLCVWCSSGHVCSLAVNCIVRSRCA